jgi:hypothetical protein
MRIIKGKEVKVGDLIRSLDSPVLLKVGGINSRPTTDRLIFSSDSKNEDMVIAHPENDFILLGRQWPKGETVDSMRRKIRSVAEGISMALTWNKIVSDEDFRELRNITDDYLMGIEEL